MVAGVRAIEVKNRHITRNQVNLINKNKSKNKNLAAAKILHPYGIYPPQAPYKPRKDFESYHFGAARFHILIGSAGKVPCEETKLVASEAKEKLVLLKNASVDCTWSISTSTRRTIELTWPANTAQDLGKASATNCITVTFPEGSKTKEWCKATEDIIQSKGPITIVRKTASADPPGSKEQLEDIILVYQLVNDAECTTAPGRPAEQLQSFSVSSKDPITPGLACRWVLQSGEQKSMQISLDVNSQASTEQCVSVSDAASTEPPTGSQICATEGKNVFTADADKSVAITFASSKELKNFNVNYQLGEPVFYNVETFRILMYCVVPKESVPDA
ncbi:unnamed protein product [Echinostoma caproni]|uniref:CUB domain-containing protein n=1 Tax=Echinostoma caproni TaxID=27848 RepID=A0A183AB40_9TREM|nr:unnamed protein product [Echinostoma caproni]